jgi:NADPH-dependent glutamate synthase beta subunit-like oxidoreductase
MTDPPDPGPPLRPAQRPKTAPCLSGCLAGNDVRGWIAVVAQRGKLGLSAPAAYERAWRMLVATNPFPAVLGRICPHPCEDGCNRTAKEGPVSINRLERFLGDWAIAHGLELDLPPAERMPESMGVVGAGPAGLSFAYQMVRRGYPVTVYDGARRPGGMLRYGVPEHRLPRRVLDAEIGRIVDLGVELRMSTRVGVDLTLERLKDRHDVLFLGIGAQRGLRPPWSADGEQGVWLATDYLRGVSEGAISGIGEHVAVVGGGNTAVDAARVARRQGADVTILYRRSPTEMPARAEEVEEAREEGVRFEFLVSPVRILRRAGALCGLEVQRMRLDGTDASGRRAVRPCPGGLREFRADAVIAAVSQAPDWTGLSILRPDEGGAADPRGRRAPGLWFAGDVVDPGAAGQAIGRARAAAEALHAQLRGVRTEDTQVDPAPTATVRPHLYPQREPPVRGGVRPAHERLELPRAEVHTGISEDQFLREAARCMSCGDCFGCEHCWIYCSHQCFERLVQVRPGAYFALSAEACQHCGKCIDLCPCGFLEPIDGGGSWPVG